MDCALRGRIEVRNSHLAIWLLHPSAEGADEGAARPGPIEENCALLIPWTKPPAKRFKQILLPASSARSRARPMKAERRTALIKSIARGRAWLDEIVSGTASIEAIAARHKCSVRQVNMTISMAFIAPALVKAAVEGRLPRGIGVATLRDAPAEWSLQFARLGLAQP
jgi:site-specific DNA recombinase